MGGKVFSEDGILTPRMLPDVYKHVSERAMKILAQFYVIAEIPIEGPGKVDHGDVDVLVVAEDHESSPSAQVIKTALGAKMFKHTTNSRTTHYAVPWPTTEHQEDIATDLPASLQTLQVDAKAKTASQVQSAENYVQLDVHLCKSAEDFKYTLFTHSHGDLWNILGSMMRPFGFSPSVDGLYARIAETESWNRKESKVKMTGDPETILTFLDLDSVRFEGRFETLDECLAYAATCRFHDPARRKKLKEKQDTTVGDFSDLKHNDRARANKRPMFAYWLEVYLPAHEDDEAGSAALMTRDDAINDAKMFFGEDFATRYDRRRAENMRLMGTQELWTALRRLIPRDEPSNVTYTLKWLKREICGEGVPLYEQVEGIDRIRHAFAEGDFKTVQDWALAHWEEVRDRQKEQDRLQCAGKYRQKLEAKKKAEFKDAGC